MGISVGIVIRAAGLAAIAGTTLSAHAQLREWAAPVSANWNVAANWLAPNIPDSAAESAALNVAGPYVVTLPSGFSPTIGGLSLPNPNTEVFRANNGSLSVGAVMNNGLIRINNGGPNDAHVRATGSVVIDGGGTIRLAAASTNLDAAYMYWTGNPATQYFTQNLGHSIRGTGNIYARVDNAGLIDADVSGATLQLLSQEKNNTGTIRATGGGVLVVSGIGIDQTGGGEIVALGGTVNLTNATITSGSLTNSGGTMTVLGGTNNLSQVIKSGLLNVNAGSVVRVTGGGLTNTGEIVVNTQAGVSDASVRALTGNQTLSGSGTITLNAGAADLDDAYLYWTGNPATETFTQAAGHTIRGTGNIWAGLANSGLVLADRDTRVLQLLSQNKSNTALGVMRATDGGILTINGITVIGGNFEALGGSTIQLTSGTISSAVISNAPSGVVRTTGTCGLFDVSSNAAVAVTNNSELRLAGFFNNSGVVTVNPTAGVSATLVRSSAGANVNLVGTGSLVLNASANLDTASLTWTASPATETLLQFAGHTISGTGNMYLRLFNSGLVQADQAGKTLQLLSQAKTNDGTFRASNGGTLLISGIAVTNNSTIEALTGSTVQIAGSTILGGTLNAAGSGLFRSTGTSVLSSVFLNAPFVIVNGGDLRYVGTIISDGVVTVNETAGATQTLWRAQSGPVFLGGTGSIVLNAQANLDTAFMYWTSNPATEIVTQIAGHTIRGTGNIYLGLFSSGLVTADRPGAILQMLSQDKTNNALFRAENGGILQLLGITVDNSSGVIEARAGSVVNVNSSVISGGTLNSEGSGLCRVSGTSTFTNLTNTAPVRLVNGGDLRNMGIIINNGVVTINETAGVSQTQWRAQGGNVHLAGTGVLVLNASANLDTAYLYWTSNPATETLFNASEHSIEGRGNIYLCLTNAGTLSPGVGNEAAGQLNFPSQVCTFANSGRFLCDINGTAPADYDRLTGPANKALNGTIAVRLGYSATVGDVYDVVTGPYSGRFSVLELARGYYIEYGATVRIGYSGCIGDWDQDGDVDSDDVIEFFGDFEVGEADYDEDGDTDSDDIILFFGSFEAGC